MRLSIMLTIISAIALQGSTMPWGSNRRDMPDYKAAKAEVRKQSRAERSAYAAERCERFMATLKGAEAGPWCSLAATLQKKEKTCHTTDKQVPQLTAWLEMLDGTYLKYAGSECFNQAVFGADEKDLELRSFAYLILTQVRLHQTLSADLYVTLNSLLGFRPLDDKPQPEQRIDLMRRIMSRPVDSNALWATTVLAATYYFATFTKDARADHARKLAPLIETVFPHRAGLTGLDGAVDPLLSKYYASILNTAGRRDEAVKIRREAAARCGAELWKDADICRELNYRVANDRIIGERLARDPDLLKKPFIRPLMVAKRQPLSREKPCYSIYQFDVTDEGSVTNIQNLYNDPGDFCDVDWSRYLALREYPPVSEDRPNEKRTELLAAFREIWP